MALIVAFLLTLFVCIINNNSMPPHSTRNRGVYRVCIGEVGGSFDFLPT